MNTNELNINFNPNGNLNNIDLLILKMKKEDTKYSSMYKSLSIIYFVFVGIYAIIIVVDPGGLITQLSGFCYILSFLIAGFYFRRYHKELNKINYTEPLIKVLKGAVKRFKLFNTKQIPMLFVVILIDLGVTLSYTEKEAYSSISTFQLVIIIQVIYWSIMTIAFLIGYTIWRRKFKPIYKESLELLKELEN